MNAQTLNLTANASTRFVGPIPMAEFLQRIAERGDTEAFRKLFQTFAPRVKAYMMRQGADPNTAEELAQETLLTVWRKAALYSGNKGSASTWIFTIARNLRINRLRRENTWVELPDERMNEATDERPPDEVVEINEIRVRIRAALKDLPPDQHEVVILSFMEGLSHSEIAKRIGVPVGTVKSRMCLAYQKIKGTVEDLR